eukprot:826306-Rhodomonas_salina.1
MSGGLHWGWILGVFILCIGMPFVVMYLYYMLYPSVAGANADVNAGAGELNCSRSSGSVVEEGGSRQGYNYRG